MTFFQNLEMTSSTDTAPKCSARAPTWPPILVLTCFRAGSPICETRARSGSKLSPGQVLLLAELTDLRDEPERQLRNYGHGEGVESATWRYIPTSGTSLLPVADPRIPSSSCRG